MPLPSSSCKATDAHRLRPGLLSVTFRQLPPREIIRLAKDAGLESIAWAADAHAIPGQLSVAHDLGLMTRDAGLVVADYSSYHRVGALGPSDPPFAKVLATALALQVPLIRVWVGRSPSAKTTALEQRQAIAALRTICDQARDAGLEIATEFHADTLTDNATATRALLAEVDRPNLRTHWQPSHGESTDTAAKGLASLLPWLASIHVFHWPDGPENRRPLAEGVPRWTEFFRVARLSVRAHDALLEFSPDHTVAAMKADAFTLRRLLAPSAH
jgi:3-dehydroshikimate dehydratase